MTVWLLLIMSCSPEDSTCTLVQNEGHYTSFEQCQSAGIAITLQARALFPGWMFVPGCTPIPPAV